MSFDFRLYVGMFFAIIFISDVKRKEEKVINNKKEIKRHFIYC